MSLSVENNSRGTTYAAKVVAPIGVTEQAVDEARRLAQEQLRLAASWLKQQYGTAPTVTAKP